MLNPLKLEIKAGVEKLEVFLTAIKDPVYVAPRMSGLDGTY